MVSVVIVACAIVASSSNAVVFTPTNGTELRSAVEAHRTNCATSKSSECFSETTENIRVASFNVHGWRDTYHKSSIDRVIQAIEFLNPDVLVLNEVLEPFFPSSMTEEYWSAVKAGNGASVNVAELQKSTTGKSALQTLATSLGLTHVCFGTALESGYFGHNLPYGNAILSRFPIISQKLATHDPPDRFQASRRIEAERRVLCMVRLRLREGVHVTVAATHLDQLSEGLRELQVSAFLDAYSAFEPDVSSRIFAGDFNVFHRADHTEESWKLLCDEWASRGWPAPPEQSPAVEKVLASWNDAFYHAKYRRSDTPTSTCWAIKPLFRIDFIFCDRNSTSVQRYGCFTDTMASDHFPIYADFTVCSKPVPETGDGVTPQPHSRRLHVQL